MIDPVTWNERIFTAAAMKRYGGDFFRKLGEALTRADDVNTEKIRAAWPDEWERYRLLGDQIKSDEREGL